MKHINYCLALLLLTFTVVSCSKEDVENIHMATLKLTAQLPEDLENAVLTELTYRLTDVSTGKTEDIPAAPPFALNTPIPAGLYHIAVEGKVKHTVAGTEMTSSIRGKMENVKVENTTEKTISTHLNVVNPGFVLAEIAIGGTLQEDGDTYTGDSYFRIYNNSDEMLYADGLVIAETAMTTDDKQNYTPDVMAQAVTLKVAYMVPGKGTDYPVKPGEFLLLCANGRNHKELNPRSFDLSKANFEWYDNPDNDPDADIDNPQVPNLIPLIGYGTDWQPSVQGNHGYVIGFLGDKALTPETYLTAYKYTYSYTLVVEGMDPFSMDDDGYKFPNFWVVDAVQLCSPEDYQWSVLAPSLDAGYTYLAESSSNTAQKCVRRKADKAKRKLIDTNNSTNDFETVQAADPTHDFFQ